MDLLKWFYLWSLLLFFAERKVDGCVLQVFPFGQYVIMISK